MSDLLGWRIIHYLSGLIPAKIKQEFIMSKKLGDGILSVTLDRLSQKYFHILYARLSGGIRVFRQISLL